MVTKSRFRLSARGRVIACAATTLVLAGVVPGGPASAAPAVACGATIATNTTLTSDVGPCPADGLVVTANNITLNLNGKRVFAANGLGDNAGVRLFGTTGVTVKNGTVEGFDDGVAVMGGSGNTVKDIRAINNISNFGAPGGGDCNLGDGIGLFDSSNNVIKGNVANHNGPYGGISIVNNSDGNQVIGNVTNNNNIASPSGANHPPCIDNEQQDEGIRVEGPGADNNLLKDNTVNGNLLAGIGIHAANNIPPANDPPNTNTTIVGNTVRFNGPPNSTDDNNSGISILNTPGLRSFGNTIKDNVSSDNAADGIFLPARSHDNIVNGNVVKNNKKDGIFLAGPSFGNTFTNVGPTLLQLTSPAQAPFVYLTDFGVLSGSGSGNVTARLVPVSPIAIPPGAFDTSASGCLSTDFAGFPSGAVALIQRGFCGRATKVANARAAGASAVVMFNEGTAGRTARLTAGVDPTTIPVLGTTFALGQQLYNLTQAGPVLIHAITNTTNVRFQSGPGADNNTLTDNKGKGNGVNALAPSMPFGYDGNDAHVAPDATPCDNNKWIDNKFGTVNQPCVGIAGGDRRRGEGDEREGREDPKPERHRKP